MVYLEIIELNFYDLNYNLRRKISDRASLEKYGYLGIDDDDEYENEKEKEKELKNVIANSEGNNWIIFIYIYIYKK